MMHTFKFFTVASLTLLASGAWAQSAGSWQTRVGATRIAPQVTSGELSAPSFIDTRADMSSASQVSGGLTYMLTDNVAIDVPVAPPFKFQVLGAGALAGAGSIGSVRALPVTVLVQYRFLEAQSAVRPYLGLGATYASFMDAQGSAALTALTNPGGPTTGFKVDSKFALTPQIGVTVVLNDRWFVDTSFSKTFLTTTTTFSTGQSIETRLNPNTFSLGVGYRF